jgi:hypothetical protein
MPNAVRFKLGKLAPKGNYRALKLRNYLHSAAPVIPAAKAWDAAFKAWPMDGNDTISDCTTAAMAHMVMLWTAYTGTMVRPTLAQVIAVYSAITGYDPTQTDPNGNNPTDTGAALTDVLEYWRTKGIAGHKIDGYAQVDPTNLKEVKQAIYLFGGVDTGVQLPQSAEDQTQNGQPWTVVAQDGGILGGHSVPAFDYTAAGGTVATWGQRQDFTWNWWLKYVDECYVPLSLDWLYKTGVSPSFLNLAALRTDLAAL